ncbi:unnamed protein product [Rhizophagus irregularis]|nr:unnamed protein product [Rhizophagus irregularis]
MQTLKLAAGKTQLCLQLCLTVQLKKELGGLEGGARVYLEIKMTIFGNMIINQKTFLAGKVQQIPALGFGGGQIN